MTRHDKHHGGRVAVIGAGICGVCCATFLRRAGHEVTLVDRQPPGEGCSFGNAGSLSSSSMVPEPAPGLWMDVPGWLGDRDGPLTIRWRYLPRLVPWLWRFLAAGNAAHVARAATALHDLHAATLDLHTRLAAEAGVPDLVREVDYLHVYPSEQSYRASESDWHLRARHGVRFTLLNAGEVHEVEPELSPHYRRGVLVHEQGYTTNPSRLVKAYAAQFQREGGVLRRAEVRDFETAGDRVTRLLTEAEPIEADAVVIAAGAWSRVLLERLGLRIPLDTERGYHVTVADPGIEIRRTVMESERKFLATPMEMGARFAGTVELASVDAEPDYRRADAILRLARRMYPRLQIGSVSKWMGCRPAMPDGLPVIGPSPRHANVWLAFGHGHTGMIGSPQTGRIIAGMLSGQPLNMDVTPFRADRF